MEKSSILKMPFFYDRYINLVKDNKSIIDLLSSSKKILEPLKEKLVKYQDYQYQEGKWTPKDILQHLIDTERIMSYRALALARGEKQTLIGYEEDKYAKNTTVNNRSVEDLIEEFKLVRESTILLLKSFNEEMFLKDGVCSGIEVTPLIFGFICEGHVIHHLNVLEERYFKD